MPEPYKVTFGNTARTLIYEDSKCRFVFTFEQGQAGVVFALPESSIRIVFDECSSQFGLVQSGKFEGFNGTFVQTLNDLSKARRESSHE